MNAYEKLSPFEIEKLMALKGYDVKKYSDGGAVIESVEKETVVCIRGLASREEAMEEVFKYIEEGDLTKCIAEKLEELQEHVANKFDISGNEARRRILEIAHSDVLWETWKVRPDKEKRRK